MPQVIGVAASLGSFLLLLVSCANSTHQIHQPQRYGEVPPGAPWVALDSAYQSPSREIVYYDPKTIRREGELATLWQLTDYKMMQGNAPFGRFMMGPHRFFSTKTHKEFHCGHKTVRLLASSEFTQHMGTGIQNAVLIEQGTGQPVERGRINQALWDVACGITPLSG